MGVTRVWLPQRAGPPIPVGCMDAAVEPPTSAKINLCRYTAVYLFHTN